MEVLATECDIIGNPALPPDSGDSYSMEHLKNGSMAGSALNKVARPSDNAQVIQRSMAGNSLNMVPRPSDNAQDVLHVLGSKMQAMYREDA
ncbi:unnamed protein product [Miscanthus lutarioriparius]|uniref:Uncharacterized protein n=1 Tax=Miscanthus lutarioriparius TaxID=422564 RepID=A0A811P6F5_9POAL|nr:unnamed protein product [Miscanthus lutarioriparius]